jgi:hypothetical protein
MLLIDPKNNPCWFIRYLIELPQEEYVAKLIVAIEKVIPYTIDYRIILQNLMGAD